MNYEYCLTPLGGVVAENVEGFVQLIGGISQHHTFFTDHDLTDLPVTFLSRIGDLSRIFEFLYRGKGILHTEPSDFCCIFS